MIPVDHMFQDCWVQTKWIMFTSNCCFFGSLHPFHCQFLCGLCFGWLYFLGVFLLFEKQPKQSKCISLLPQSLSEEKYSVFKELPPIQWSFSQYRLHVNFCNLLWPSALCLSVSMCCKQIHSTSFIFSSGNRGKVKCTVMLTAVFSVPTRARGVLQNQQHAQLRIFPKLLLHITERKVYINWACHLYRGIRLYLHALWNKKQVSRNEKKNKTQHCAQVLKNFLKQFLLHFSEWFQKNSLALKLTGYCLSWKENLGFNNRLIPGSKHVIVVKRAACLQKGKNKLRPLFSKSEDEPCHNKKGASL